MKGKVLQHYRRWHLAWLNRRMGHVLICYLSDIPRFLHIVKVETAAPLNPSPSSIGFHCTCKHPAESHGENCGATNCYECDRNMKDDIPARLYEARRERISLGKHYGPSP